MALAASGGDKSRKSMEDVWKDIKLPCLEDSSTSPSVFRNLVLHDFFLCAPSSSSSSLMEQHHSPSLFNLSELLDDDKHKHKHSTPRQSSLRVLDCCAVCPNKRSRKHVDAYTHELEQELALLRQENATLRQQQLKFPLRPLDPHPKKRTLLRTSTAPF
ncbi:bZIP transcription factor 27-like [Senna tora]|uniref:BZIP transcription factor 27-like n=1 Tax=Senna tora TaxID=362788 RepID=A0A834TZS1_9FABA|nr:bZIP transcription factor 27-like [Senna tora]